MAETQSHSQAPDARLGRRHECRSLANVRSAKVTEGEGPRDVKARRMSFSRRSMEVFGAVLIASPVARFRVWLYPEAEPLRPEQYLEFNADERWRIVGVVERVVDGELVSHDVMVDRHGY
jgi:hypothetical protein